MHSKMLTVKWYDGRGMLETSSFRIFDRFFSTFISMLFTKLRVFNMPDSGYLWWIESHSVLALIIVVMGVCCECWQFLIRKTSCLLRFSFTIEKSLKRLRKCNFIRSPKTKMKEKQNKSAQKCGFGTHKGHSISLAHHQHYVHDGNFDCAYTSNAKLL